MVIKEGYKQTEIGVIPMDWEVKKLRDIGKFSKGQGIRKDDSQSGEIPCVRYGELYTRHNDYIKQFYSFISKEISLTSRRLKFGDILFAGSGETKEEIGKCVAFVDDIEAYSGGDIVLLSPINQSSLYLGFLLNAPFIQKQKASRGQGDAVVHISASQLENISIPIPTLTEQTAIANALSDADGLITGLEKLIAKKRNIKQGVMQQLLQPKDGWEVKKLGEIFTITAGGDLDVNNFSLITDEKYCYPIYSNALTNKGLYGFTSEYRQIENTITVTARGQVGVANPRDHKYTAIGRVIMLNPIIELNINFITECINNFIKFNNESTGVPQLTAPQISKYEIIIPDYKEQTQIAKILSDMDAEISSLEQKLEKYKKVKLGMMQELLTGKTRLN